LGLSSYFRLPLRHLSHDLSDSRTAQRAAGSHCYNFWVDDLIKIICGSAVLPVYTAIFNAKISSNLGPQIAAAVLPLGLSPKVLPEFIGLLAEDSVPALLKIPGVTPPILGAGAEGLKMAYLLSLRYVWVTAACLSGVAAIDS
jgi:hypothetical protein